MGGIHNMISIKPEVHRLTRTPLYIHQDDAKGCHNRIIRNHANLKNKTFLILDNVGKYIMRPTKRWDSNPNFTTQCSHQYKIPSLPRSGTRSW